MRRTAAVLGVLLACGCAIAAMNAAPSARELVFLTRGECVNMPKMRGNLDAALKVLDVQADYVVVDLDALAKDDPRIGYPTPTVLYKGADLFGMPTPRPPFPVPT
jgi:hypothetical protein